MDILRIKSKFGLKMYLGNIFLWTGETNYFCHPKRKLGKNSK